MLSPAATLLGILLLKAALHRQQGSNPARKQAYMYTLVAGAHTAALLASYLGVEAVGGQSASMPFSGMIAEGISAVALVGLVGMSQQWAPGQVYSMLGAEAVLVLLQASSSRSTGAALQCLLAAVTCALGGILALIRCSALSREAAKSSSPSNQTTLSAAQGVIMVAQVLHAAASSTLVQGLLGPGAAASASQLCSVVGQCGFAWALLLLMDTPTPQVVVECVKPEPEEVPADAAAVRQEEEVVPAEIEARATQSEIPLKLPTLQEILQSKQNLISEVSHDMRTPLNGIIGLSDALLQGTSDSLPEAVVKSLNIINSSGRRMVFYINDVMTALEFAAKGMPQCVFSNMQIGSIIEEAARLCRPLAMKGVSINTFVPTEAPAMLGDPEKLLQVVYTLVSGCCRLSMKGDTHVEVLLSVPGHVVLRVTRGERPGELALNKDGKLQESSTGSSPHSGFSVDVAKQIVEGHGGQLVQHSMPKVIHQFSVLLPMDAEAAVKQQQAAAAAATVAAAAAAAAPTTTSPSPAKPNQISKPGSQPPTTPRHSNTAVTYASSTASLHEETRSRCCTGSKPTDSSLGAMEALKAADKAAVKRTGSASSVVGMRYPGFEVENADTSTAISMPNALDGEGMGSSRVNIQPRKRPTSEKSKDGDTGDTPTSGDAGPITTDNPALKELKKFTHSERYSVTQVLSVDDDPTNQMVIQAMLEPLGMNVVQAMDGREALAVLDGSELLPDIILLDVMMPNIGGYEVCRKFRDQYSSSFVPIIMVSAKTQEEDIVQGLLAGASDYVTKPFKHAEILARIKSHLQASRDIRQQILVKGVKGGKSPLATASVPINPLEVPGAQHGAFMKQPMLPRNIVTMLQKANNNAQLLQPTSSLVFVAVRMDSIEEILDICNCEQLDSVVSTLAVFLESIQSHAADHDLHCVGPWEGTTMLFVAGLEHEGNSQETALSFGMDVLELSQQHRLPRHRPFSTGVSLSHGNATAVVSGFSHPALHFVGPAISTLSQLIRACPANCVVSSFKPDDYEALELQLAGGPDEAFLWELGDWQSGLTRAEKNSKEFSAHVEANTMFNLTASSPSPLHIALQMVTYLRSMMVWNALTPSQSNQGYTDPSSLKLSKQQMVQQSSKIQAMHALAPKEELQATVRSNKPTATKLSSEPANTTHPKGAGEDKEADVARVASEEQEGISSFEIGLHPPAPTQVTTRCSLVLAKPQKATGPPHSTIDLVMNPAYRTTSERTDPMVETGIGDRGSPRQQTSPSPQAKTPPRHSTSWTGPLGPTMKQDAMPRQHLEDHPSGQQPDKDVYIGAYRGVDGLLSKDGCMISPRNHGEAPAHGYLQGGQVDYQQCGGPYSVYGRQEGMDVNHSSPRYMPDPAVCGPNSGGKQLWQEGQLGRNDVLARERSKTNVYSHSPRDMNPPPSYAEAPALLKVLREAGLDYLAGRFIEQELTVDMLSALSDPELKGLGLETLGSRLKLRLALQHAAC